MVPWRLIDSDETLGRTFARPMGYTELGFYYDACYNLTADVYFHSAIATEGSRGDELFQYENVLRAWTAVKQRFPLAGARFRGQFATDAVEIVVSEKLLAGVVPGELNFGSVTSFEDVDRTIDDMVHGPQRDFHNLPFRLFILRQTDHPHRWHAIFDCMHALGDAASGVILYSTFFDILTLGVIPVIPNLQERLAAAVPSDDLNPTKKMTVARQRWRRAMAAVIYEIRESKTQGGYSLPRTFSSNTYSTPAIRGCKKTQLPYPISQNILQNCRRNKISLGAAVAVWCQMATARVLHRRYLRGDLSDQEWAFIKKQPTHSRGPLNMRPYLDKEWYEKGGWGEYVVSIAYFSCTLPSFSTPPGFPPEHKLSLPDGAPSFSDLLSHERFFLRCNMIKKQMREHVAHPLFVDIAEIRQRAFLDSKRNVYRQWHARVTGKGFQGDLPVNGLKNGLIYNYEWTTIPELETILPSHYPLPSSHNLSSQRHPSQSALTPQDSGEILMHLLESGPNVHPRPTDLYLSVGSSRGNVKFLLLWDKNVYADDLMLEWLDEVQAAAAWYLGGDVNEQGKL